MSKERVAGLIFLFLGIYGVVFSINLPFGRWEELGPGVYPLCICILLCVSGVLWFIRGDRKGIEKARIDWHGIVRKLATPLQIIVITAAFIFTLSRLGYLVASSLYLFVLLLWVCRYRLWTAMMLAIVLGVGSWYFFGKILDIQLPKGFLTL